MFWNFRVTQGSQAEKLLLIPMEVGVHTEVEHSLEKIFQKSIDPLRMQPDGLQSHLWKPVYAEEYLSR